jgi:hypothetical protein
VCRWAGVVLGEGALDDPQQRGAPLRLIRLRTNDPAHTSRRSIPGPRLTERLPGNPQTGDGIVPANPENRTSSVRVEKGTLMLEWKARILTLLVAFVVVADQLGEILSNNWNW